MLTANELLAEQENPRKARTAEIDDWLREQLAEGPLTGDELERRGDLEGWTPKQVRGARDRLKARGDIGKQRSGFGPATVVRWGLRHTLTSASVMPSRISNAHSPERAGLSEKGGTEDDEISLASVMPSSISNALITERAKLQNEGRTADAAPDLLDIADAPTLTVTASNGTPLTLTRQDLTPQPPLRSGPGSAERCSAFRPCRASRQGAPRGEGESGCAHEYAQLRDAKGKRACVHCHTIEGTEGERLKARRGTRTNLTPSPSPTGEGS